MKEKYQKKIRTFKSQMSAKMNADAITHAQQARMAAESAHAHMSASAKELAGKAKRAREVAQKARKAAMGMAGGGTTTTTKTVRSTLRMQAKAAMKKSKAFAKAGKKTAAAKLAMAGSKGQVKRAKKSLAKAANAAKKIK